MAKRMDFFMVPRSIFDQDAFAFEPYTRREALLDLIQMAAYEPKMTVYQGGCVELERGQVLASVRFLASRWGWGKDKVTRALKAYKDAGYIGQQSDSVTSLITINNFDLYQGVSDTDGTQIGQISDTDKDKTKNIRNKKQEEKEKDTKVSTKKDIDEIYAAYPTRCPKSGRNLGKSSKDKKKIETLLKTTTKENLLSTIAAYLKDCQKTDTYIKNFSTFLNNLPDYSEPELPMEKPKEILAVRSPEDMAKDAWASGERNAKNARLGIGIVWGDKVSKERVDAALAAAGFTI